MKNFYLMYVIKKPYIYFCFILIGITVILCLLFSTTVPVVNTYSIYLDNEQGACYLSCNEPIFNSDIKSIFIYEDKNKLMYQISNYVIINNKQILVKQDLFDFISESNSNSLYIDVSKSTVTLFKEIFVQGGKN